MDIRSTRSEIPAVTIAKSWMKPGLIPLPKMVESTPRTGFGDAIAVLTQLVSGNEFRCGHHVDAGIENANQFVDVGEHRVVDDAVRLERKQCVDIIGGLHPQGLDATELAYIAADLVR